MSDNDVLFGYRQRLFTLAREIGVRPACRAMGVHHSTHYRMKAKLDRYGLDALRIRECRKPRMPNQIGPHIEQRIIGFSLAHPGFGPRRISAELAREKWGGIEISENGVWRVLKRHGLNTRTKRLSLIAGYADSYERKPDIPPPERHIEADRPGHRNYATVGSDLDVKCVIEVLDGKDVKTVVGYLKSLPDEIRNGIERPCNRCLKDLPPGIKRCAS